MAEDQRSPLELYDRAAADWVRTGPVTLSDFTGRPPTLAMCEPVSGLFVLDLGCGEGYCARHLRRQGARRVVGIDISPQMIRAARAQEERDQLGIEYHVGDGTDLSGYPDGCFDLVLVMFMFNYLDLDATQRALAGIARVLRPGGKLVFAVPHPAFAFLRAPEPPFSVDVGRSGYFSARGNRLPGRIWKRDGSSLEVQVCHKTLEDYFEALAAAGFAKLPIVRELHVTPQLLASDPPFFGPVLDVPIHLAVSVRR